MKMDGCKVIHIGLPKAGSTSIQHNFFSCHRELNYFSLRANGGAAPNQEWFEGFFERLRLWDDINFNYEEEKSNIDHFVMPYCANRSMIISLEGLTGRFGIGIGGKAVRLKSLFPNFKILLIIREPFDLLRSMYMQDALNVNKRHFVRALPDTFEQFIREALNFPNHPLSPLTQARYGKMARTYRNLFGEENIKIIPLERLRDEPKKAVAELASWMGLSVSYSQNLYLSNTKILNKRKDMAFVMRENLSRIRGYHRLPPFAKQGVAEVASRVIDVNKRYNTLSKDTERKAREILSEECKIIEEEWRIDIRAYGYP